MAYSPTTWLSGSTITTALINNLETQYDQIKKTYMDKFSTASTGTMLMNITTTQTFLSGYNGTILYFAIPGGWQQSRLELSITGKNAGTGNSRVYLFPSRHPYLFATNLSYGYPPMHTDATVLTSYASLIAFTITTNTGTTANTFACRGGEYFNIGYESTTGGESTIWNIRLSGTSTTITDAINWVSWTASPTGTPTSTG